MGGQQNLHHLVDRRFHRHRTGGRLHDILDPDMSRDQVPLGLVRQHLNILNADNAVADHFRNPRQNAFRLGRRQNDGDADRHVHRQDFESGGCHIPVFETAFHGSDHHAPGSDLFPFHKVDDCFGQRFPFPANGFAGKYLDDFICHHG